MSKTLNFESIEQGATFSRVVTIKDPDGNLVDLTDCTARMQFRPTYGGVVVCNLTTENGKITLGAAAGTITLEIPDTETADFQVQTLKYDLELIWPSGKVDRIFQGSAPVTAEVTK